MNHRLEYFAKEMRREPTRAECLLYNELLKALSEYDMRVVCQEPISYFIADFMIYPQRIVVEVDGGYHLTPKAMAYDKRRESSLKALGIRVMRFPNARVFSEVKLVVDEILRDCAPLPQKRAKTEGIQVTICPPAYANGAKKRPKSRVNILAFNTRFKC